jgi:hypothetical protein
MRVTPDDEVYRVNTVWLGPSGLTFPWTARYLAYATWLAVFLLVLLVEAVPRCRCTSRPRANTACCGSLAWVTRLVRKPAAGAWLDRGRKGFYLGGRAQLALAAR